MSEQSKRLISLDMFRGMTIMGMILVNNPGSWSHIYAPLKHASWHGWTPTDFIFPFFLFIVGVAMSLSISKRVERGDATGQLYRKVVRRTVIIFAIGILLSLIPYFRFATIRIPGVLQRIAVCYLITALIIIKSSKKMQIIWTAGLLLGYWLLVKFVPVPGYGAGILEAEGSLCWYIDKTLLAGHTWRGAPFPGFDPEGIVSTIPAIASTLLGVFTGDWLRTDRTHEQKVLGLFVYGNFALLLGWIMSIWLPINKSLWTSSYTVFMAGMALIFLAMSYWLIDIKGKTKLAKPFIIFGSNAILVFSMSSLTARIMMAVNVGDISLKTWIYENLYASWAGPLNGSLFYALIYILIWLGIMTWFYKKKIFVKI